MQDCNIRVLEPEKLESTKRLQEDCASFVSKVDELNESLSRLSGMLEGHAAKVESAKLQAVGLRNKASAAEDYAKMRRAEDQSIIAEKQRDLEVRIGSSVRSVCRLCTLPHAPRTAHTRAVSVDVILQSRPLTFVFLQQSILQRHLTLLAALCYTFHRLLVPLVSSRRHELQRLRIEYDTLDKYRQEQELVIAKLSSTT